MEETLKQILGELRDLKADVGDMKTDINGLKTDVSDMKTDINGLKTDVGDMKTDIGGLKADVSDLKSDVGGLKVDVSNLKIYVSDLKEGQERIEKKLEAVYNQTANLTEFRTETNMKLDDIIEDLRTVELVTSKNYSDIVKLKAAR